MSAGGRRTRSRFAYETRLTLLALLTGTPALVAAMILLWTGGFTPKVQWTVTIVVVCFWLGAAFALRERVVRPLQTLSNMLAALREEDYSMRARSGRSDDALGEVFVEANALGQMLREQRLGAMEATALLRTVMVEIDVAVFTFDGEQKLRLVNRAGERLLGRPADRLLGRTAEELALAGCLDGEPVRAIELALPGASGRWGVRVSTFREKGLPHRLLVLADLTRTLREEELQAWKRLVRVLGHELNNSLTPIKSIAGSLRTLLEQDQRPPDWKEDTQRGLDVIAARAEALSRFMEAYARLAKLPPPKLGSVDVEAWVRRVAGLETRLPVTVEEGPAILIRGDGDQLDQLLINLIRNAADASLETHGGVRTGWRRIGGHLEIWVQDDGPGISNTSNLFVPFFTTKASGSGIGLVLSRQIAEAHGGVLALENRSPGPGCEARLRLPM
ncbi:MAG TPA: ATP-binding protein [Bryobacteraceae bacterium]|nr:ATP-binding protein [Bryobacteraceae bacterium]